MLEKDNLQEADGKPVPENSSELENNPEKIVDDLKDEGDNLVEGNEGEVEAEVEAEVEVEAETETETETETERNLDSKNDNSNSTSSENNPENIVKDLKDEADNLVEGNEAEIEVEAEAEVEAETETETMADSQKNVTISTTSKNNPENIVKDLKDEADNLVEGNDDEVEVEVETEAEAETMADSQNDVTISTTSENNPENMVIDLKDEADNLVEADEAESKVEVARPSEASIYERKPEVDGSEKDAETSLESTNHESNDEKTEDSDSQDSDTSKILDATKDQLDKNVSTASNERDETPSSNVSDNDIEGNEETNRSDNDSTKNSKTEATSEVVAAKSSEEKKKHEEAHVDEIEESNAEDAEDSGNEERHKIEAKDYSTLSMVELNDELEKLIKNQKIQTIKKQVDEIRSEFKSKFEAILEEKKEEFVNDGGNEIDFYYSSNDKKRFNELYKSFKFQLTAYYKDLEKNLKANLANRLEIIEEIKGLINVEENINTTYRQFKDLQEQWRNAGPIPRDKYNNTWNTYHHHVEIFYDFLHLNRDLRDMDFKHNLDQKLKIIERAEELAKDDNINRAFRELQVLHKMWKEDLGPVAKENRDEIWDRFSSATKKIHDKRQDYYADLDKAYEANYERKQKIINEIEKIVAEDGNSHQSWQNKIKSVEALRQEFFNAGKVPKKVNEPTWAKFKAVVRAFNKNKNLFYKNLKQSQYDNLKQKKELIKIAEANMESEDFETVTPLMKKIQNHWKKIGHVPRKDSDKIWKQFKHACNQYFDRLHAKRKEDNKELYDAYDKKVKVLEGIKSLKLDGKSPEINRKKIEELTEDWKAMGQVPQNKRYIEGKFNRAINDLYDKLKMDKKDIEMIKYENKLEHLSKPEGTGLLDNEQNFIRKKIDELKSEINQLENNMQFFSNVDKNNPLVKDVFKNIDKHKSELDTWEKKLNKLKGMYS